MGKTSTSNAAEIRRKIRLATRRQLALHLTTSSGWQRFVATVPERSISSILGRRPRPKEFGYLLLLEDMIGPQQLKQVCPLVTPISKKLLVQVCARTKDTTPQRLQQDPDLLYQLLWRRYSTLQGRQIKQHWPTGIEFGIDEFLHQLAKLTGLDSGQWYYCQMYLDVQYGLTTGFPIRNSQVKLRHEVLRRVEENFTHGAVNQWGREAHDLLSRNDVISHLKTISRAFHQDYNDQWSDFYKLVDLPTEGLLEELFPGELAELDLDSSLSCANLLPIRIVNGLEKYAGVYTFRQLQEELIIEADIRALPNFGVTCVEHIKQALRMVREVMEKRATIKAHRLDQEIQEARRLAVM